MILHVIYKSSLGSLRTKKAYLLIVIINNYYLKWNPEIRTEASPHKLQRTERTSLIEGCFHRNMYIMLSSSANRSQIHHGQHVIPSCLTGLSSQHSGLTILLKLNSECIHSEWSPSDCGQFYSSEVLTSPLWNWLGVSHLRTPWLISKNKSNSWHSCSEVMPWPFLTRSSYALPRWGINSYFSNVPTALFQILAMSQLSLFCHS